LPGIYIHIPFCKQACHYCNFHFSTSLRQKDELIQALEKEISLTGGDQNLVETIYFGGGTPSLLEKEDLERLFDALRKKFRISPGAEITLEANPDDINPGKLRHWQETGINRLSVGIQSFQDEELRWMNRAHGAADSIRSIREIMDAGFTNYSIDLIYGSPLLTDGALRENLQTAISLNIPHLSCYALTLEPKTALHHLVNAGKRPDVDTGRQADQFLLLMDQLADAGYEHYEISNFALPGMRSRHNSSYWQGKPYYGFGPSAHGYDGKRRRWNLPNNALYIQSLANNELSFEEEILTPSQQVNEYIMTSLRTSRGLDLEKLNLEFGEPVGRQVQRAAEKYLSTSQLNREGACLILTRNGKLFADGIAADLFI
jgi:oxygen-independent coproporphyrinogen-3 oxidase